VRPALEFNNVDAIKDAVSAGLGMALIPSPAVTLGPPVNSIIVRPLDPPLIRTLGVVQRRNKPDNPALRVVRQEIMTLANAPEPEAIRRTPPGGTTSVRERSARGSP
jgi:DNA-binding transcriptional LysR family regulator